MKPADVHVDSGNPRAHAQHSCRLRAAAAAAVAAVAAHGCRFVLRGDAIPVSGAVFVRFELHARSICDRGRNWRHDPEKQTCYMLFAITVTVMALQLAIATIKSMSYCSMIVLIFASY